MIKSDFTFFILETGLLYYVALVSEVLIGKIVSICIWEHFEKTKKLNTSGAWWRLAQIAQHHPISSFEISVK